MSEERPTETGPARVAVVRRGLARVAHILDTAIRVPGTNFRFGVDALIGLVPYLGDAVGVLLSGGIIASAARLNVPKTTLVRMCANVAIEALLGVVPFVGDLFDAAWKANARNVALLDQALIDPQLSRDESNRAGLLLLAGLAAVSLALTAASAIAGYFAWRVVFGS